MLNSIVLLLTSLCIVFALSESQSGHQAAEVQSDAQSQRYSEAGDEGYTYQHTKHTKRSISRAAKAGLLVMKNLLTGAKKIYTSKHARFYLKKGNRQTALNDFNSVKPVVATPNMNNLGIGRQRLGEILFGRVGDRRLKLMLDGDKKKRHSRFSPTLEIRSATGDLYDVIVYKMER